MSESTTSESEAPHKVAKKKGRAKAARKKAAKPSALASKETEASGAEQATAEPSSPPAATSEPAPSPRQEAPPAAPDQSRNHHGGDHHATPPRSADRRQEPTPLRDRGATVQRSVDEGSPGRGQDRTPGGGSFQENRGSRNRRRNRGERERSGNHQPANAPRRTPEITVDLEELKAKAWHIYSTEVCEEGIRFVDDTDAGKLVRRCYKLADTFLRFQYRQQSGRPDRDEFAPTSDAENRADDDDMDMDVETPF